MASKETNCGSCKREDKISDPAMFCNKCQEYICKSCMEVHIHFDFKEHQCLEIDSSEGYNTVSGIHKNDDNTIEANRATDEIVKDTDGKDIIDQGIMSNDTDKNIDESERVNNVNNSDHTIGEASNKTNNIYLNTLCDMCKYRNEQTIATFFCEDCQEILCDECMKVHKRRKATSEHQFVNVDDMKNQQEVTDIICDPCNYRGLKEIAKWHCELCDEYLCQVCNSEHNKSKATKDHKTINITGIEKPEHEACSVCKMIGRMERAVLVCDICEENLCKNCIDNHRLRKATKDHILRDMKKRQVEKENCDICQLKGEKQVATLFCDNCKEHLCKICAEQHKYRKATRDHVLADSNIFKCSEAEIDISCEPCRKINKVLSASNFCPTCVEFLCSSCSCHHGRMKVTADHNVIDICKFNQKRKIMDTISCDPCNSESKAETAKFYCKMCNDYLCQACSGKHKIFKATKDHKQFSVVELLAKAISQEIHCDVCDGQNNQVDAIFVCNICEENLCESCSEHHTIQKATREHQLVPVEVINEDLCSPSAGSKDQYIVKGRNLPGTPVEDDVTTESIRIRWKSPSLNTGNILHYDVRFREEGESKWRVHSTEKVKEMETISDLKSDTAYQFKVRAVLGDEEGPDSNFSEYIKTKLSLARKILEYSVRISQSVKDGHPAIYKVPIKEHMSSRNEEAKTRKCFFGEPVIGATEKTIMVVGTTGAGKSTLIDGMVNYILDVSWEDDFRFTLIDLMEDELVKKHDQTMSQTEWITCYTMHLVDGGQIYYTLNIIDTPGFGDTRGIEKDNGVVEQIRELFTVSGEQGISTIDAVCFVTQAPLARLTMLQRYIIDSILSIFGRDIIGNIFALITFADGKVPPVLEALNSAKVPIAESFFFNNSALFAQNKNISNGSFSPMFWKMGKDSFKAFFKYLNIIESRSLQLTSEVLQERKHLETMVQGLQPQIDEGLSKIEALRQEKKVLERHKLDIEQNQNFTYEVNKTCQRKVDL